jgi:hypothetical protein
MTPTRRHLFLAQPVAAPLLIAAAVFSATVWAESTSSAASSASSASVGSLSNSVQGSSNASSPAAKPTAGLYRIEAIAALDEPGHAESAPARMRLTLAHADGRAFDLLLPRATVELQRLARGEMLRVSAPPYGLAFAHADAPAPFFLALSDDWLREIDSRPVAAAS